MDREGRGRSEEEKSRFPRWLAWLVLLLLLLFCVVSLARCTAPEEGGMRVRELRPPEDRISRVSPATSQAYGRSLRLYSEKKAAEALTSGDSFVAPAAGLRQDPPPMPLPAPRIREKPPRTEAPARERQAVRPAGPAGKNPAARPRIAPARKGDEVMLAWLSDLNRRQEPGPGKSLSLSVPAPRGRDRKVPRTERRPAAALPGLREGDILYAVNRVSLDSDAPGPAMAEICAGAYAGSRVLGSFQRLGERLVLRFTELVLPDGARFAFEGCAVDPRTDRAAVRSQVDRHLLARWGGLVAASFLQGFGEAVRRSGTRSYATVYGSGEQFPDYSLRDELWIAAGRTGERAAGLFERNFSQPPTVTLRSGTEMGVLVLRLPDGRESLNLPAESRSGSPLLPGPEEPGKPGGEAAGPGTIIPRARTWPRDGRPPASLPGNR